MKVLPYKIYTGLIVGLLFILFGAYLVVASPDKKLRDAVFTIGIISTVSSLAALLLTRKRVKLT